MADETHQAVSSELRRVHKSLAGDGYALTTESDIGLPVKCAENLRKAYFDSGQLRHDDGDMPQDRERARDVVLYQWNDGKLTLEEYETIAIRDRSGIKGERIHKRIELLQDRQASELVETFLSLVPVDRRQPRGTFGVNLFRTHTDVVSKPHHDDEQFIILYVVDRLGDGAESYLYRHEQETDDPAEAGERVLFEQLNPGDLMIFEDKKFKHGATPLTPLPGEQAKRDVLVCTIDYPTTYLERQPVS